MPNTIDCEQVLMSLLGEEGGAVPKLLAKQGIDPAQLRDRVRPRACYCSRLHSTRAAVQAPVRLAVWRLAAAGAS